MTLDDDHRNGNSATFKFQEVKATVFSKSPFPIRHLNLYLFDSLNVSVLLNIILHSQPEKKLVTEAKASSSKLYFDERN